MPKELQVRIRKAASLPPNWFKRTQETDEEANAQTEENVKTIIRKVMNEGDIALVELTEKFDKSKLTPALLRVSKAEIKKAYSAVSKEQITALKLIKKKLSANEKLVKKQLGTTASKDGVSIETELRPIESVGCYVPGGLAAYPSTLIMTATPAKVAGVPRIVVCSPPDKTGSNNPLLLVAADICQVDEFYKIGGAQAIAALAYGTETIKPVRKIVGPGNKYVTIAKMMVSKDVAIDMPAGPSEILVLADETANPQLIALDMISQAEHGKDSIAGLITTSKELADKVLEYLRKTVKKIERKEIVSDALSKYGFIILCQNIDEMIANANAFAPEHIEIVTRNSKEITKRITSAGLILIGPYSPVALSDYGSGTNHVLPTGGFGRVFSGLSVLDFLRRVNVVESSKEGLLKLKNHVKVLTEAEKLPNHYKAVEARFKNEKPM